MQMQNPLVLKIGIKFSLMYVLLVRVLSTTIGDLDDGAVDSCMYFICVDLFKHISRHESQEMWE